MGTKGEVSDGGKKEDDEVRTADGTSGSED